jgi:hypothetical protein
MYSWLDRDDDCSVSPGQSLAFLSFLVSFLELRSFSSGSPAGFDTKQKSLLAVMKCTRNFQSQELLDSQFNQTYITTHHFALGKLGGGRKDEKNMIDMKRIGKPKQKR